MQESYEEDLANHFGLTLYADGGNQPNEDNRMKTHTLSREQPNEDTHLAERV